MEYRLLGRSGLKISALTLGTMTFGGEGFFAKAGIFVWAPIGTIERGPL